MISLMEMLVDISSQTALHALSCMQIYNYIYIAVQIIQMWHEWLKNAAGHLN